MLESARLAEVPLPSGRPGGASQTGTADIVSIDANARQAAAARAPKQIQPVAPAATASRVKPSASEAAASMESRAGGPLSYTKPGWAGRLAAGVTSANRLLADAFVY
jgi:hypothetical protein